MLGAFFTISEKGMHTAKTDHNQKLYMFAGLFVLILTPILSFLVALWPGGVYSDTYVSALSDKCLMLHETEGKRILLIGGSGVAFNYRADLLQAEFPEYRVINFGLYGGIGTTVMLDLAKPGLREGDVVILSPELTRETMSDTGDAMYLWQGLEEEPKYLLSLAGEHGEDLLNVMPRYVLQRGRALLTGKYPEGNGIYRRSAFGELGDVTFEGRPGNSMAFGYDPNMLLSFGILPDETFLASLSGFMKAASEKQVKVYYRVCPMNMEAFRDPEAKTGQALETYEKTLAAGLPCEILGTVEEALYEKEWFYDTNFHLNASGALRATAFLALDLKKALGMEVMLSDDFPEVPKEPGKTLDTADRIVQKWEYGSLQEDLFTYEYLTEEKAWRILSLKENSLPEDGKLRIPETHEGFPVISFSKETFPGNNRLKELWIPESIRVIEDGSFADCRSLKFIRLMQSIPSEISAGQELLKDCGAQILVPADALGAYMTDYFWSRYGDRIRGFDPEGKTTASETEMTETEMTETEFLIPVGTVLYDANGGSLRYGEDTTLIRTLDASHLRINSLQGTGFFIREGYCLTGWNTAADGTGIHIGLGSRMDREWTSQPLYAVWEKENPADDFTVEEAPDGVRIAACRAEDICVIPSGIDGKKVTEIGAKAFEGKTYDRLVIPSTVRIVEDGAFEGCIIRELVMFDTLQEIGDRAFDEFPETLYVNAARSPVFSGTYFDTFSDKYDRLLSIKDRKKIVLSSGSSGRYGYDSAMIQNAFPEYEVVNMGVYAYSAAYPQLMLIRGLMKEGDILVSAPEFDAIQEQFCIFHGFDRHSWAMMESDYDMVAALKLRDFTSLFDGFTEYQRIRASMEGKNYSISPNNYDDEGTYYVFGTYNQYGDFVLPRENADKDERHRQNIADYTIDSFPLETIESLNAVYRDFEERGVKVYFSYTPRNRSSLSEQSTLKEREKLHAYLTEYLRVPVITQIEDSLYSGIYFWKIDSHLSSEGQLLRTKQIIRDLEPCLKEQ